VRGVVEKGFTTTAGAVKLETVGKAKVTCSAESGAGEYSGAKTVSGVVMRFTGCESAGAKCSSSGANEGEVITNPVEGTLGITSEGIKEGVEFRKIGLDLFPVGNAGTLMAFSCGATPWTLRGSVIVPVAADKMALSSALTYKAAKGMQLVTQFEGEPQDILESSRSGGAFEQTGLGGKVTLTNKERVEINAFT
jgi:hypothetical protein